MTLYLRANSRAGTICGKMHRFACERTIKMILHGIESRLIRCLWGLNTITQPIFCWEFYFMHFPVMLCRSFCTNQKIIVWLSNDVPERSICAITNSHRSTNLLIVVLYMLATTITLMILVTSAYPDRQEILANAKVRARQQCVYEGTYRRNLQLINYIQFPINR